MQYRLVPVPIRRAASTAVIALTLGAAVAACGSSSTSSSNAGATSGSTGSTSGAQFQARLNLAKCFRAHGINVPDPSSGGGTAGGGGGGVFRALRTYPQAQVQSATQACRQYFAQAFPRLNLSPAQRAQVQQQLVKFAQCMRSHGVNIPDPTFNANGGFGFRQAFGSVDRNSPAFQSASTACRSLRPNLGGRGGGGGPAPGGPGA
jgi:hypothetical protein